MLFIWALDTKKTVSTNIEVTAGVGKESLLSMEFQQQQLEGSLLLRVSPSRK